MSEVEKVSINNWLMQVQCPEGEGPFPVVLMLHGWTGDENSMWVFAPRLLKGAIKIAPRGYYASTSMGGYSWHPDRSKPWPWVSDFSPTTEAIIETVSSLNFPDADMSRLHLVGFSQGAALAYTIAIMHPERITSLAGLSGFLPDGASSWLDAGRLQGMPVFVTHGTQDDLVPVERARKSVEMLEKAGASVTYCEDDVGHKLSVKCFRGLEAFYSRLNP